MFVIFFFFSQFKITSQSYRWCQKENYFILFYLQKLSTHSLQLTLINHYQIQLLNMSFHPASNMHHNACPSNWRHKAHPS